jgi:lambda repressor-like predicted transcriptional regulator
MADNEEILDFKVQLDIRDSLKALQTFTKAQAASMKAVSVSSARMGKEAEAASMRSAKASEKQADALGEVAKAYDEKAKKIENLQKTIRELEKVAEKADREEQQQIKERIDLLQKEHDTRKASLTEARKAGKTAGQHRHLKGDRRIAKDEARQIKSELKDVGQAMVEPMRAFLAKDAKGFLDASVKGAAKIFSKDTTKALSRGSRLFSQRGSLMSAAGSQRGGIRGAMTKGAGVGLKGVGKALGGLSKMLKPLAKLGPMLGAVGGGLMAIVKLFLDADSMVKEMNKNILQSASNIEFMAAHGSGGMAVLKDSLESVNKAATDASFNNRIGITKDEHTAIINVLTQEGVSLKNLDSQAKKSNRTLGELTQSVVASGVAYSRALGVPLQEINQLQAEMMVEMGSSIEQTELAFAQIARSASESGIAANKFFAAIKGASQDLSVWNMRMEDSVKLLGTMGKIMSPRNAQKFFQEMSSGFTQLGRQDLLKQSMMAGAQATKEANEGTMARMRKQIAGELGISPDDVKGKSFKELLQAGQNKGLDPQAMSMLTQQINQLETMRQGSKGGTYGQAYATRHADTAGQLKILEGALERYGGTLENPTSMAIGAVADSLGKSPDFVEALANLARTASAQKEIMLEQAKQGQGEYTVEQVEAMTKQELVNELGKTMLPKSDEDIRKSALQASEKQAALTQDIMTKFSNFVDSFMVRFYYTIMDILDWIKAIYKAIPWSKDNYDHGKLAGGEGGKALMQLLRQDGGTARVGKAVSNAASGQQLIEMMQMAGASKDQVASARKSLGSGRGLKKAGQYDAMAVLKKAGMDPSKVFEKALWGITGKEQQEKFVQQSGLQVPGAGLPPVPTSARPSAAELTGEAQEEQVEVAEKSAESLATVEGEQFKQTKEAKKQTRLAEKAPKDIKRGNLENLRQALYEFYLYKDEKKSDVIKALGGGNLGGGLDRLTNSTSQGWGAGLTLHNTGKDNKGTAWAPPAQKNAAGGLVTGIANGMAIVAAQGEGLASVGKGERIVPAGAGGGPVTVNVAGVGGRDLANLIEGKVVEGIREYKRREKLS